MRKFIALFTAPLILAGCFDGHNAHSGAKQNIVVSDARIRPLLPGRDITSAYFTLTNEGSAPDALIAAASPIAGKIELHTQKMDDGVMKMRRVDKISLPAGETVALAPGGYHLMLFDVVIPEGQTEAALTLGFEHAPEVTIIAEIAHPPVQ